MPCHAYRETRRRPLPACCLPPATRRRRRERNGTQLNVRRQKPLTNDSSLCPPPIQMKLPYATLCAACFCAAVIDVHATACLYAAVHHYMPLCRW